MRRIGLVLLGCFIIVHARAADTPRRKFLVFFQQWSAALSTDALTVIGHASDFAKANPDEVVHVNAFTDPTGSRKANALPSDLRAQVVMDPLQHNGVSETRMLGQGHGSVRFALTPQESRRVGITVGGQ